MSSLGKRKELGQVGEQLATEFLLSKGYLLLTHNFTTRIGEIDLLMQDESTIVVVEVKTLSQARGFDPIDQIDGAKQRKLQVLAQEVAARYPTYNVRIDAVTVYWENSSEPVVTHFENIIF